MPQWRQRRAYQQPSASGSKAGCACGLPFKFPANGSCAVFVCVSVAAIRSCRKDIFSSLLLKRIVFNAHEIGGVVFGCRMRPPPLRKGPLFGARAEQQTRVAIVSFMAAWFI